MEDMKSCCIHPGFPACESCLFGSIEYEEEQDKSDFHFRCLCTPECKKTYEQEFEECSRR